MLDMGWVEVSIRSMCEFEMDTMMVPFQNSESILDLQPVPFKRL